VLTREHAIAAYEAGQVHPDRLTRQSHRHYLDYAERMLHVYRTGIGRTRRELHRAAAAVFAGEDECPQRRIEAFSKLLDDVATYRQDRRGRAAALRREVFRMAAPRHPLVREADRLFEAEEQAVKREIAAQLGRSWEEIDRELFADVIEFHRLAAFEGYPGPEALLARYNVAQVQAALFDAVSMTVWATEDFKTILRYAKLARLMHAISRTGDGQYCLRFDGPASVLRETRRYGAAMSRFLPALVACRGWRMHAVIRTRRRGFLVRLELSADDGLNSHLPAPDEFDSQVEEAFAAKWGPEPRDGWSLSREGEILHQRQKVFVPDFAFRHDDGRTALLEIVGFWTPEYLQAKLETLQTFADHRILLAVAAPAQKALAGLPAEVIPYRTALLLGDVLERLGPATG
jgi:predicted nuclease of restriction endonuclease-like RecB superfamily